MSNNVWHTADKKPENGRWVLVFYSKTRMPSLFCAHECVNVMAGAIWAYVWDLLKEGMADA